MGTSKILIIDDNADNGYALVHLCRRHAPEWQISWLRVTTNKGADAPRGMPDGVTHSVINSQVEAANAIKQNAADDLIVFYDLQLSGVQETTPEAETSQITYAVRDLMNEPTRRMLVRIHSADRNSSLIAPVIDESNDRVFFRGAVTGKSTQEVQELVIDTLERWNSLYLRPSLDAEGFISAMEMMTHQQIQDYAEFLKEMKREGLTEYELRKKYLNPANVLMHYLGMHTVEFNENFCIESNTLKEEVIEALKSISGLYSLENQAKGNRQLSWGGAWLLALGVFRELKSRDTWKAIFDVADLRGGQEEGVPHKWPYMHAIQKPQRRAETVRLFARMTKVLFTKRGAPEESVLEHVDLTANEQPNKLSFRLSFPCVGAGGIDEQHESLLGRLVGHLDDARAVAEGKKVEASSAERDTSRAIWRFFLSASICDLKAGVEKPGYGMAGGFSPMNIMSIAQNTKTEVLWLN